MRRLFTITYVAATTLTLALLCFTSAHAKKPDNPGGGGGGGPAVTYRIIRLDTSNGNGGILGGSAQDLNNGRLVVGNIFLPTADGELAKAACWSLSNDGGSVTSTLNLLDDAGFGNLLTSARGCNDVGEIVGFLGDVPNAVYWSGPAGVLEFLPAPAELSAAEAVNNSGVICGYYGSSPDLQAAAWYLAEGEWAHLALSHLGHPPVDEEGQPLPDQSWARAISNPDPTSGVMTIVGQSNGNAAMWTVALESEGLLVAGPAMILDPGAEASGLNNTGTVCGFGHLGPSSGGDGVVWVDAGLAQLLTPTLGFSGNPQQVFPVDVNDGGLIVGDNFFRAVVWTDRNAAPILLDDFLAKGKRATFSSLSRASAVNEWNEIVGHGNLDGLLLPFLAIPEQ